MRFCVACTFGHHKPGKRAEHVEVVQKASQPSALLAQQWTHVSNQHWEGRIRLARRRIAGSQRNPLQPQFAPKDVMNCRPGQYVLSSGETHAKIY
jgi:hypothetical protein